MKVPSKSQPLIVRVRAGETIEIKLGSPYSYRQENGCKFHGYEGFNENIQTFVEVILLLGTVVLAYPSFLEIDEYAYGNCRVERTLQRKLASCVAVQIGMKDNYHSNNNYHSNRFLIVM
jgi:hypothetical protein